MLPASHIVPIMTVVITKRQEASWSSPSSSRRRDRAPNPADQKHQVNAVGCMPSIFHLISKYQNRRKFLTFGRKEEKHVVSPTKTVKVTIEAPMAPEAPTTPPASKHRDANTADWSSYRNKGIDNDGPRDSRTLSNSSEVDRSPPIRVEIRRSSSPFGTADRQTQPQMALVARLMGPEGIPGPPTPKLPESEAAENRRKLLGALEKCDEDLKALKKIIEAVRFGDRTKPTPSRTPPPMGSRCGAEKKNKKCGGSGSGKEKLLPGIDFEGWRRKSLSGEIGDGGCFEKKSSTAAENGGEQPSPVSVLYAFSPSSISSGSDSPQHQNGRRIMDQQLIVERKKSKEHKLEASHSLSFLDRLVAAATPAYDHHPKIHKHERSSAARTRRSMMVESLEEVLEDEAWGHNREVIKIGLVLQDYISKDLIDELVKELGFGHLINPQPLLTSKRKLLF